MTTGLTGVSGAKDYNFLRHANKANALPVSGASYSDTGLAAATTYSWTVKSIDTNSAESVASSAATGTTSGTPVPAATCYSASNYAHTTAGRAYQTGGNTYANESNQTMGLWNNFVTTTLKQTGANYYVIGTC